MSKEPTILHDGDGSGIHERNQLSHRAHKTISRCREGVDLVLGDNGCYVSCHGGDSDEGQQSLFSWTAHPQSREGCVRLP